eukprot:1717450-Prymnesium_polylepis.1
MAAELKYAPSTLEPTNHSSFESSLRPTVCHADPEEGCLWLGGETMNHRAECRVQAVGLRRKVQFCLHVVMWECSTLAHGAKAYADTRDEGTRRDVLTQCHQMPNTAPVRERALPTHVVCGSQKHTSDGVQRDFDRHRARFEPIWRGKHAAELRDVFVARLVTPIETWPLLAALGSRTSGEMVKRALAEKGGSGNARTLGCSDGGFTHLRTVVER